MLLYRKKSKSPPGEKTQDIDQPAGDWQATNNQNTGHGRCTPKATEPFSLIFYYASRLFIYSLSQAIGLMRGLYDTPLHRSSMHVV
jgi:hypothetical protein